jgi:hypothetical protein
MRPGAENCVVNKNGRELQTLQTEAGFVMMRDIKHFN